MASFLATLLRRKGPSDVDGRPPCEPPIPSPVPPPTQPPPVLPPTPTPIRIPTKDTYSAKDDDTAGDLTVTRRQSSQVNLNRFFASAPVGLHAVLKAPSRPDIESPFTLVPASPSGHPYPSSISPFQAAQNQDGNAAPTTNNNNAGDATDTPLSRPARERRRSMTVSEIAASMQNIDVSQAAMIMMPSRMRQELCQESPSGTQVPAAGAAGTNGSGITYSNSTPHDRDASGHLPQLSKPSLQPNAAAAPGGGGDPGSPNAAVTAAGFRDMRNMDRRPSIIREAVKHQHRSLPLDPGPSPGQRSPGASMIAINTQPHSIGSGTTDQSVQGSPMGRAAPVDRRGPPGLVPTMQLQQHLIMHNSAFVGMLPGSGSVGGVGSGPSGVGVVVGGGGASGHSSRASMSYGGSSAQVLITGTPSSPSPQPPMVGGRSVVRQSDPGEPFRSRAAMSVGLSLEAMLAGVSTAGGGLAMGARRGMMANNNAGVGGGGGIGEGPSSAPVDDEALQFAGSGVVGLGGSSSDIKLPSITSGPMGPGGGRRGVGGSELRDIGGGGGKGGLTAADVAALAEAMNAAQNDAARLRASALRNVEGRTKRSFVDVEVAGGSGPGAMGPSTGGCGGGGGNTGGASPGGPIGGPRAPVGASGGRGAPRPPQLQVANVSPGRQMRLPDSPRPGAPPVNSRFETPTRNKSSQLQDLEGGEGGGADVSPPPHAGVHVAPVKPRGIGADVPNARRRS